MLSFLGGFGNTTVLLNKKKKVKKGEKVKDFNNPIENLQIYGFSKMGYGPKKTEC